MGWANGELMDWFGRRKRATEVFFKFSPEIKAGLKPDDRFLVSYPRSGNTWVRFVLAAACALRAGESIAEGSPGISRINAVADQAIPDLHVIQSLPGPSPWTGQGYRIFKSHNIRELTSRHVLYLFRRPQDSLLSYAKFAVRPPDRFAAKEAETWAAEAHYACQLAGQSSNEVVVISYEQMLAAPLTTITTIAGHLNLGLSQVELARALEFNAFDRLQAFEKTSDGKKLARGGIFFGSGNTGRGDSELDAKTVSIVREVTEPVYQQLLKLESRRDTPDKNLL